MLYQCDICEYKNASEYKYNVHMKSKLHKSMVEIADCIKELKSIDPIPVATVISTHPLEKGDPHPLEKGDPKPFCSTHPLEKGDPKAFNLDNHLNVICKNAFNFDNFVDEYLLHPEHNNWINYVGNGDEELILLNHLDYSLYPESISLGSSFFCKPFNNLEYFQKPIFCSNMKQCNYYIKENDRWKLIDTNLLYSRIFNVVIKSLSKALRNTTRLSSKNFEHFYKIKKEYYNNNYEDALTVIIYGMYRDDFIKKINMDLPRLCSRNQVMYDCPKANKWTEFTDDSTFEKVEQNDCDSDEN